MERKVKVGIIGCGFIANAHFLGYRSNPCADVVAVADSVASAAEKFAQRYGIPKWYSNMEQLLEEGGVEAVSICTPHPSHAEIAVMAAQRKKHILVEKPMACNLDEAEEMIKAANEANVKLMVAFVNRFVAPFREAKQLIDAGALGNIVMLRSHRWGWIPWSEWYYDPKGGGGLLPDRFCYGVDFARWLTGSEIDEIFVYGDAMVHTEARKKFGRDFIDNAKILMKMKNGVIASAEESYSCRFGYYERVEVLGSDGLIIADPFKHDMLTLFTTKSNTEASFFEGLPYSPGWNWPDMVHFPLKEKVWGSFAAETKHFIDCILNDHEPLVTGKDGKAAIEGVLAAMESYRKGEPVKLPFNI
ncbi:MAG TPA: Gfo/Idh/MocA family oxidoreductase [Firmicutes bacterium]|nr:Gfo/Idh/MocA family oxidoreductase [Bacillota bacterium]